MTDNTTQRIDRVGIVGCGMMGAGIAELCACSGVYTRIVDRDASTLDTAQTKIDESMLRAVARGRLDEGTRVRATGLLCFSTGLREMSDCDLVIEAATESLAVKRSIFAQLDGVVAPNSILASNTSSIPIGTLAATSAIPCRVIGMHFFNPVPARSLLEVIPSMMTAGEVVRRVSDFSARVLHRRIVYAPDRAGFVVNALLFPYILSAIRMYESGLATAQDIDVAMAEGCGHPLGPLALADLVGLDTTAAIAASLYTGDSRSSLHLSACSQPHGPGRAFGTQERPRVL